MRVPRHINLFVFVALLGLGPQLARAEDKINEQLERAVRVVLLGQARQIGLESPSVQITVLPDNLRKAPAGCAGGIRVDALDTRATRRMRFAVSCAEPNWRSERIVRASVSGSVVVAVDTIPANRPIDSNQLTVERREIFDVADAFADTRDVVGKATKKAVSRGEIIGRRWLVEAVLVERGSQVSITVSQAGLEARVAGEVLEPGRRNDVVRVRNTASGKVIRARVLSRDTVEPADMPGP